jgi:FKBP-type peptidyl-prolyl cis-trans isomerase FkpA
LKLKTWFASLALVLSAAACGSDGPTEVVDPGPPPPLPAGAVTITTNTGLQYVDVAVGSGATVAQSGNRVRVHYTGWLASNNQFFDTSRGNPPLEFILGQNAVIAGFDQGIRGMKPGGKRRLIIPPALGYGADPVKDNAGRVVIPGNSTLIFDVELVTVS